MPSTSLYSQSNAEPDGLLGNVAVVPEIIRQGNQSHNTLGGVCRPLWLRADHDSYSRVNKRLMITHHRHSLRGEFAYGQSQEVVTFGCFS